MTLRSATPRVRFRVRLAGHVLGAGASAIPAVPRAVVLGLTFPVISLAVLWLFDRPAPPAAAAWRPVATDEELGFGGSSTAAPD